MRRVNLALRLSVVVVLAILAALLAVDWLIGFSEAGDRRPLLLLFVPVVLAGGLAVSAALDRMVVRPIQHTIREVERSKVQGWARPIRPSGTGPELQALGESLEDLRSGLVAERDALEVRVEQRSAQLERAQRTLAEQARLAALGQLAAGVAHEVNNPNSVVLARVGYLLSVADEEGLDPDVIEDLEIIEHQVQRIATITGNLLKFGRPGLGERAEVAVDEVLQLTHDLLARQASQAGIELGLELSGARVHARRGELEQVAFNLVRNALDACSEGQRVVLLGLPDGFAVSDQGPGMPPEIQARVFEPFFSTKGVGQGTGLGLSVSYGIVAEHGGSLEVESQPGQGSTFTVRLPRSA